MAQILVAAMTAGALFFLVAARFIRLGRPPAAHPPVLTWLALAVAASTMLIRLVVPPRLAARQRQAIARRQFQAPSPPQSPQVQEFLLTTGDAGLLWLVFVKKLLMAGAPVEGATFLAGVAYLVEGSPWALGAAVLLVATLAMMIPRREAAIAWIEDQLRLVEQERQQVL